MIALLPAALAAAAYLIWQSNRSSYDHHLIEQTKGHVNAALILMRKICKDGSTTH